jgi:lambda family phage portal protein
MSIFDLFRGHAPVAQPVGPAPAAYRQPIPRKRKIEAGEVTRLNASWNASNLPADEEIRKSLDRIRARSRDLAYNNEYAKKYLQMVQTHVVGPAGFNLQSLAMEGRAPDRLARDAIELAFWQWGLPGVCEASGRHSFPDFTRLVIETVARDGEALILRRRGAANAFGYELKLLEIDRLPVERNEQLKDGNSVVMGVELNADGRAVAYHLNLGQLGTSQPTKLTRVPAADVLHIYRPMRPEQHRGLPWMTPVMSGLKMLAGYEEAAIVAARVGAAKMGFYTSPDGTADPLADDQVEGEFYQDAEAGAFAVLPPGYDFKAWDPDYPHQGYKDFVQARLRSIASGLGIAYHTLANDLADVNYSSARAGTLEERDNWIVLQNWLISSLMRPVFMDWLAEALKKGAVVLPTGNALPVAKQDKFAAHEWQGRRWTWVDPLKDIEAARLAIKTGIASPQMIAAQSGVDVEDVLQDIARFEQRVAETGAGLIDFELTADKTPAAPEPAPAPDNTLRDMVMAVMARSMEPREAPPPASIVVNNAPPAVTFHAGETRVDNHLPAPEIHNQINVEPTPIEIRAGDVFNEISVEPTPITAEVNIDVPPPEVRVNLPARRTVGTIERDANGNITRTEQIETDADDEEDEGEDIAGQS